MPERPLLILPAPGAPLDRRKKGGGPQRFRRPTRGRQGERLTPRFEQLQIALNLQRTRLQSDSQGLVPEEVIVLETIGTVSDFVRAVERVPGLEWLGEIEEEDIPPDEDFFATNRRGIRIADKELKGRLFLVFANQVALGQMLSLWEDWKAERRLARNLGRWATVFAQLHDVRRWSARDRLIETGVLEDWHERLEHGEETVPCEIELWYRQDPQQRQAAADRVARYVTAQGGDIIHQTAIDDISYHAMLAALPATSVAPLLQDPEGDVDLIQCEQVQFFRAAGQTVAPGSDPTNQLDDQPVNQSLPTGSPIIALLDGVPLQAHDRLRGRLKVDDPDGFEASSPASERQHGTAMASLIVHGDLTSREPPIARPLYVRPILLPDPRNWRTPRGESAPPETLIVDLVHRCVRRLVERDGDIPAVAPSVAVVNFSIGIRDRPFHTSLSPLARLIDWLSWKYKLLFVVSAGNHLRELEVSAGRGECERLSPGALQDHIIRAVAADSRNRRLLSPAESINALTVGALHQDPALATPPPGWLHPYSAPELPSPITAHGMGYRRAIKPDILAPGGRVLVQERPGNGPRAVLDTYTGALSPGQTVATPGPSEGLTNATRYSRGTSNAAALTSRGAAMLYELLEDLRREPDGQVIDGIPRALWLKALLAHGARWGDAADVFESILRGDEDRQTFREHVARFLGYGASDYRRASECTPNRVTALSGGILDHDKSHIHRFPLPPSLSGRRGRQRLTVTLAWITPINPKHQSWRRVDLWFAAPVSPLRLDRTEADWQAVQRGTLQHEILEGEDAPVFLDGTDLEVQVSRRADGGRFDEAVPYALATTLEVAEEMEIDIYSEVRARVQAQIRVSAGSASQ